MARTLTEVTRACQGGRRVHRDHAPKLLRAHPCRYDCKSKDERDDAMSWSARIVVALAFSLAAGLHRQKRHRIT
jgi:hypothetical protein